MLKASVRHSGWTTAISTLAISGQGVTFLLSIVMARHLGVDGFEAYVVASAAFILMVTCTPRGTEKFALQLLPVLLQRGELSLAKGYLQFGVRRTFLTSLAMGSLVGLLVWHGSDFRPDTRLAIIVSCVGLPAGALVHFAMEVLTAAGHPVTATAIVRVAVPAIAVACVGFVLAMGVQLSGAMAVACWGLGWVVALAMLARQIWLTAPPSLRQAIGIENASAWGSAARPFWIYRITLALLGQSGVIALDLLQPSGSTVGAYAAAVGTASLALVLATATNRVYAQQLSVLLETRDFDALQSIRRKRLQWLVVPLGAYLVATLGFPSEVLALFRSEFVVEGAMALRVLAVATTCVVLLAMAPTYVKFRRHNRATYIIVASAATAQIGLLMLLVPTLGATGAAWAYALAIGGMYGAFAWMAHRELALLRRLA